MYFIVIILLMINLSILPKRIGISQPRQQENIKTKKDDIIKQLDALLKSLPIDDEEANALIFELALFDKNMATAYLKKIITKTSLVAVAQKSELPSVPEMPPVAKVSSPSVAPEKTIEAALPVMPSASKDQIIIELDKKLRSTIIDDAWYKAVDNLIFDLALIDRDISSEYLKKVLDKMTSSVAAAAPPVSPPAVDVKKENPPAAPSSEINKGMPPAVPGGMKVGNPPPPPAGMKKGTPPAAPGAGPIKKGGTPPPPPGPMTTKGKGAAAINKATEPEKPKGLDPLSERQTYGLAQLMNAKRTDEEIVVLFNKLLDALGTVADFWDAVKKEPKLDWSNKIGTAKNAVIKRNIPIDEAKTDPAKKIADRIVQVRADKAKQGLEKQVAVAQEEKKETHAESLSEKELIIEIEKLRKEPKESDFAWVLKFQGFIKRLDQINHEKAVQYESEFLKKYPKQKSFLPKKKAPEAIKKELTTEEKIMADIDKILQGKEGMWAIKAKNPIQELYDMNPDLGLQYQDKYLAATKAATGKDDKPFLQLKK